MKLPLPIKAPPRKSVARRGRCYQVGEATLPGVTTLLGQVSKPQLVPWATKTTAQAAADLHVAHRYDRADITADQFATSAAKLARAKQSEARDLGTAIHDAIYQALRAGGSGKDWGDAEAAAPAQARPAINAASIWAADPAVDIIATEVGLASTTLGYAGTADLIVDIDGHRHVADWKTGKGVYPEAWLQLAAYALADHYWAPRDYDDIVADPDGGDGQWASVRDTDLLTPDHATVLHLTADGLTIHTRPLISYASQARETLAALAAMWRTWYDALLHLDTDTASETVTTYDPPHTYRATPDDTPTADAPAPSF